MDLVRVEFVQDDVEDIKATVQALRQRVGPDGYVFSSGGIGPTHDDVTYEAIAAAFGERSVVLPGRACRNSSCTGHCPLLPCSACEQEAFMHT